MKTSILTIIICYSLIILNALENLKTAVPKTLC